MAANIHVSYGNSRSLHISNKRAGMMIKGLTKENKALATKMGFCDKFFSRIISNGLFEKSDKEKKLEELFEFIKTDEQINDFTLNKEHNNLKAIGFCIALSKIMTTSGISGKFIFEGDFVNLNPFQNKSISYKIGNDIIWNAIKPNDVEIFLCNKLNNENHSCKDITLNETYKQIIKEVKNISTIRKNINEKINHLLLPEIKDIKCISKSQKENIIENDNKKWKEILEVLKNRVYPDVLWDLSKFIKFVSKEDNTRLYKILYEIEQWPKIRDCLYHYNIKKLSDGCYSVNGKKVYTVLKLVKNIASFNNDILYNKDKDTILAKHYAKLRNSVSYPENFSIIPFNYINDEYQITGNIPIEDNKGNLILGAQDLYKISADNDSLKFDDRHINTDLRKENIEEYTKALVEEANKCLIGNKFTKEQKMLFHTARSYLWRDLKTWVTVKYIKPSMSYKDQEWYESKVCAGENSVEIIRKSPNCKKLILKEALKDLQSEYTNLQLTKEQIEEVENLFCSNIHYLW